MHQMLGLLRIGYYGCRVSVHETVSEVALLCRLQIHFSPLKPGLHHGACMEGHRL
jgi:hypothetical protein